jgi:hypothetical protein
VNVGVILPVDVGVGVAVNVDVAVMIPVDVGVAVDVAVEVGVDVGVWVDSTLRFTKTTIVCEADVPSTMVTTALPPLRFLLINRFAGIV